MDSHARIQSLSQPKIDQVAVKSKNGGKERLSYGYPSYYDPIDPRIGSEFQPYFFEDLTFPHAGKLADERPGIFSLLQSFGLSLSAVFPDYMGRPIAHKQTRVNDIMCRNPFKHGNLSPCSCRDMPFGWTASATGSTTMEFARVHNKQIPSKRISWFGQQTDKPSELGAYIEISLIFWNYSAGETCMRLVVSVNCPRGKSQWHQIERDLANHDRIAREFIDGIRMQVGVSMLDQPDQKTADSSETKGPFEETTEISNLFSTRSPDVSQLQTPAVKLNERAYPSPLEKLTPAAEAKSEPNIHWSAGMKKIRINELARELEVKPGVILDMLPELGVEEKKTHSSSVDEDVALELRRRITASPPFRFVGSYALAQPVVPAESASSVAIERPAGEEISEPSLRALASGSDPHYMLVLARKLKSGIINEVSPEEYQVWYRRAASLREPAAINWIAGQVHRSFPGPITLEPLIQLLKLCRDGDAVVPPNHEAYFSWLKELAYRRHPESCLRLALHLKAQSPTEDPEISSLLDHARQWERWREEIEPALAFDWAELRAERDRDEADRQLTDAMLFKAWESGDLRALYKLLERGNVDAQFAVAQGLEKGDESAKKEAWRRYDLLSAQGYKRAEQVIIERGQPLAAAHILERQGKIDQAIKRYKVAAEQDETVAMMRLAELYMTEGSGRLPNWEEGMRWLAKAESRGEARASMQLGQVYEQGLHAETDLERARIHYKQAVDTGLSQGLVALAQLAKRGRNQRRELEVPSLYQQAIESGDSAACYWMGLLYETGRWIDCDLEKALSLYIESGNRGNSEGAFAAGLMLEYGRGAEKSEPAALEWYKRAAALDHPEAKLLIKFRINAPVPPQPIFRPLRPPIAPRPLPGPRKSLSPWSTQPHSLQTDQWSENLFRVMVLYDTSFLMSTNGRSLFHEKFKKLSCCRVLKYVLPQETVGELSAHFRKKETKTVTPDAKERIAIRAGQGRKNLTRLEDSCKNIALFERPHLLDFVEPVTRVSPLDADSYQDRLQIAYALWALSTKRTDIVILATCDSGIGFTVNRYRHAGSRICAIGELEDKVQRAVLDELLQKDL